MLAVYSKLVLDLSLVSGERQASTLPFHSSLQGFSDSAFLPIVNRETWQPVQG